MNVDGLTRRGLLATGIGAATALTVPAQARAASHPAEGAVRPALLRRAIGAFRRHRDVFAGGELIGIADFAQASRRPRFHLVDMDSGRVRTLLVAHGRGSDPGHSGWLRSFSNGVGTAASSSGAYLTGAGYEGRHGASRRLIGLDPDNSNAEARAIVVHGAWYVGEDMVRQHGKIGRSEGCFAFAEAELPGVLKALGPGRMIYADKV